MFKSPNLMLLQILYVFKFMSYKLGKLRKGYYINENIQYYKLQEGGIQIHT